MWQYTFPEQNQPRVLLRRTVLQCSNPYIIAIRYRNKGSEYSLALQVQCFRLDLDIDRWYTHEVGRIVDVASIRSIGQLPDTGRSAGSSSGIVRVNIRGPASDERSRLIIVFHPVDHRIEGVRLRPVAECRHRSDLLREPDRVSRSSSFSRPPWSPRLSRRDRQMRQGRVTSASLQPWCLDYFRALFVYTVQSRPYWVRAGGLW